tara:strand:- start:97 stop:288 length:192 start_codon:yes stop_codon:yes gene_type:complete
MLLSIPADFKHNERVKKINSIDRPEEKQKNNILITLISLYVNKDFFQPNGSFIIKPDLNKNIS